MGGPYVPRVPGHHKIQMDWTLCLRWRVNIDSIDLIGCKLRGIVTSQWLTEMIDRYLFAVDRVISLM